MRLGSLVLLPCIVFVSCAAIQQGPPIELADVAVPTVVQERPPLTLPVPPPASLPRVRDAFKMWVPRFVTANGDVYEGHYVDVSDTAPQKELTKPDYEIPKAPKHIARPQPKTASPSGLGTSQGGITRPPLPPLPSQGPLPPPPPIPQEGPYESPQP